jgi:hypothetical protein
MPSAAAFLRPSLLASRRSGEGLAVGGGVDGVPVPGTGPRVASVGTGPADGEVGALRGRAPARSTPFGWRPADAIGLADSPTTESGSLPVTGGALAAVALGGPFATPVDAGGASSFAGLAATSADASALAAGGATAASGGTATFGAGGVSAFAGWAATLAAGGTGTLVAGTSG